MLFQSCDKRDWQQVFEFFERGCLSFPRKPQGSISRKKDIMEIDENERESPLVLVETASIPIKNAGDGLTDGTMCPQSALCLVELSEGATTTSGSTPSSSSTLCINVLAVVGNNELCSWFQSFECSDLVREWNLDDMSSCAAAADDDDASSSDNNGNNKMRLRLLWDNLRKYLSLDNNNDDNNNKDRSDTAMATKSIAPSSTSPVKQEQAPPRQTKNTTLKTEWTLLQQQQQRPAGDGSSSSSSPSLLLEVKQGRKGLMRNLWKVLFESSSSPSQAFHNVVLHGTLSHIQQQREENQQLSQKLNNSIKGMENWKQTAKALEHGWHQEKGPLLQNFLTLYNSQQEHVQELQTTIAKLESQLEQYHHGDGDNNDDDLVYHKKNTLMETKTMEQGAPDDHEMEVDKLMALQQQAKKTSGGRRTGASSSGANNTSGRQRSAVPGKRRNKVTGAIEYLDEDSLFADTELFGRDDDNAKHDDDSDDNDSEEEDIMEKKKPSAKKRQRVRASQVVSTSTPRNQKQRRTTLKPKAAPTAAKKKTSLLDHDEDVDMMQDLDDDNNNNKEEEDSATDDEADYIDHGMREEMLAQLEAMKGG